jgi:glycosyltransferase involved in cell wall biosynthesis
MRLLYLVHGYPPATGGVEFSSRDLCERLVAQYDVDVTVFTTNAYTVANFTDGSLPTLPILANEEVNGVKIRRFPFVSGWAPVLRQVQRIGYHLNLPGESSLRTLFSGPISPQMRRAVKDADVDVICAASFPCNHLRYPFRRPRPRPPVILVGAVHTKNDWAYRRPNLIRLIAESYATVAHTEHERDWLVAQGAPADRMRVIGHGIEVQQLQGRPMTFRAGYDIPQGDFVVAFVGQQAGHKGIDTLISAFPRLRETRPDARLVLAGSQTPYSAVIHQLVERLAPADRERVLVLRDISTSQKADILADCDVFASPSREESFGITTLEAWANRKPVILGDGPAVRLVVEPDISGLLVPYADSKALARALVEVSADPGRAEAIGEAGFLRLRQRYDLSEIVDQYFNLFSAAVTSAAG